MRSNVRSILTIGFVLLLIGLTYNYRSEIASFILQKTKLGDLSVELNERNEYTKEDNYNYVQKVNYLEIQSKQDIINAYYSIINSGAKEFIFYCKLKYSNCISDIKQIINNQTILSNINSFVHPYNSFSTISTEPFFTGRIKIKITKPSYADKDIEEVNKKVDEIIQANIKPNMKDKEKIKVIHDYIIDHSKYDSDRSDRNIINYKSDIAYGPLIQGYGICGGYTDAMAIFLNRFGIPNFKVISENHIWNAVYLDNKWYHLDLTWDDPVDSNGADVIEYNIFLITTDELEAIIKEENKGEHNYDRKVFSELQ